MYQELFKILMKSWKTRLAHMVSLWSVLAVTEEQHKAEVTAWGLEMLSVELP